jgi:glycerol-3-phosphate cytidylyltransferase-like family protein
VNDVIVGVLSDENAAPYKRTPIMTPAERVAVIEACRYVDEVVAGAPFRVDADFVADVATPVEERMRT